MLKYENIIKKIKWKMPAGLRKKLPKEIKVAEVSLKRAHELNKKFLKKNKAANVLSFKYDQNYGEIAVCPEVIRAEAKIQGNNFSYQMTWMILHGMIHLAGRHHEESRMAEKYVSELEKKILDRIKDKESRSKN